MSKKFAGGEVIFREGDNGDCLYEVISGTVSIYSNYSESTEQKLTDVQTGHIFGEMALVDAFPRSATAVAATDVELEAVTIKDVRSYFKDRPDKIKFLLTELGSTLTRLTNDYDDAVLTVNELYPETGTRKPGIADKIKKFVDSYKLLSKASKPSAEYLREADESGHGDGFTKKVEKLSKGTVIFREGEPGKCMYDIHFGSVGIYTGYGTPDEKQLTTLYANKFFGELGLLANQPRTATAVALEDGTIVENIYMEDFDELFEKNPAKIEMVIKHLSFRIRRLTYEYINACKIIYDAAEAELKDSVTDELKKKAQEYKGEYFN